MARTACLVCFVSTLNGRSNKKKKRKVEAYPWKTGPSSGHITNLKQSILETFDIYGNNSKDCFVEKMQLLFTKKV
jgi:hypothetical protein